MYKVCARVRRVYHLDFAVWLRARIRVWWKGVGGLLGRVRFSLKTEQNDMGQITGARPAAPSAHEYVWSYLPTWRTMYLLLFPVSSFSVARFDLLFVKDILSEILYHVSTIINPLIDSIHTCRRRQGLNDRPELPGQ